MSWKLGLSISLMLGGFMASGDTVLAQIAPDRTLGSESSVVAPNVNIHGISSDRIEGGAIRGANLFHSFQQFNIGVGRGVYFANPAGIVNILSRVTGGNISNILGTLGVLGNANLFLINPNGITLGPNARLDLRGSFLASTANSLIFEKGLEFSATNPAAPALLTVNMPIGLRFRESAGSVIVNGSRLQVDAGKTLAIAGGNLILSGGNLTAERGRIELGSVTGESVVNLKASPDGFALDYQGVQNFQDIQLSQQAVVDASGAGAGNIQVQGRQIRLTDGSQIRANTRGSLSGGTLTVKASDSVEAIGRSGDGTPSALQTRVESGAAGSGGNLTIIAKRLRIEGGARVAASSLNAAGKGGNLTVLASDSIELIGVGPSQQPSALSAVTTGSGNAGEVRIETGRLMAREGGQIDVSTEGSGSAGSLTIQADEVVVVGRSPDSSKPSGLLARVEPGATGNGGNLSITTRNLSVQDGARISTASRSEAQINPNTPARAGTLTVQASQRVEATGGGQITTSTLGVGNGSDMNVTADEVVAIGRSGDRSQPSGLLSRVEPGATGNAGDMTISARRLLVRDGARVAVASRTLESLNRQFQGGGGELTVRNAELVEVTDAGGISAITEGQGDAGSISVQATDIRLRRQGEISAISTSGLGKIGNITIQTETIVLLNASKVQTDALPAAEGGNIAIEAPVVLVSPDSIIKASGNLTISGNLQVQPSEAPQVKVVDPANLIAQNPCDRQKGSKFIITGRGGLPPNPIDVLSNDGVHIDFVEPAPMERGGEGETSPHPESHLQSSILNPIVPASGWVFNDRGEVVLIGSDRTGKDVLRARPAIAICSPFQ